MSVPAEVVTFHRVLPGTIAPMRADRSALGTIPVAAYQYCEALCSASAFGWYVFAPCDIALRWNGADVLYRDGGRWRPLTSVVPPEFAALWDASCPPFAVGKAPPLLTALFVPGLVQIWSGYLVRTLPDWSVLVRPLVNCAHTHAFRTYEAIVETDTYGPWPLFINIQLIATDIDIEIPRQQPLFQVQQIPRPAYRHEGSGCTIHELFADAPGGGLSEADWQGYCRTVRAADPVDDAHEVGQYAVGVRRRAKTAPDTTR